MRRSEELYGAVVEMQARAYEVTQNLAALSTAYKEALVAEQRLQEEIDAAKEVVEE